MNAITGPRSRPDTTTATIRDSSLSRSARVCRGSCSHDPHPMGERSSYRRGYSLASPGRLDGLPALRPPGWGEQPQLAGTGDRLGAGVSIELGVDVAHVGARRVARDAELGGNLGCFQVAGQVPENAQFGVAEVLHRRRHLAAGLG